MSFVHLHNHTEYSLLDGVTHVGDMVKRAAELGMPAVAITDHGVMSGAVELENECRKLEAETGKAVKPIFGCEVYFADRVDDEGNVIRDSRTNRYHLLLLAKDNGGYHNLLKLVSESHLQQFYRKPLVTLQMLQRYGAGLVGTSACVKGIVSQMLMQGRYDDAAEWARKLAGCFDEGDFYIEVQNHGLTIDGVSDDELNSRLSNVAEECGLKLVATNDFHYLVREDALTQDMIMTLGFGNSMNDPNRRRYSNDEFYMKTEEEMRSALGPDFQQACDNTVEIAEKCNVVLERDSILPRFPLPEGETEESYFRRQVQRGLEKRYGNPVPKNVQSRADYEMNIIAEKGFPAYFLLVQEYLQWARDNGIGVGPGRGSAAGAVVAYAMGITDVEPISNGLMFERFLNPERMEMPDIDCDFEKRYRDRVIDHIKELYGEDHVSQVITFQVIKAKNAVRDAARLYGLPISMADRICKLIGDANPNITIGAALEGDEKKGIQKNDDLVELYASDYDAQQIINAARRIEGQIRGEGVHACATIICRDPMSDHVPMKRDTKREGIITQYDGHVTPDLGLLKMDFLGLRTLDLLAIACENVKKRYGITIEPERIPVDDEGAFALLRACNCDGLFQVEGPLYTSLFHRYPPRCFADVVASIALNRPGPLDSGMLDGYIEVATGKSAPNYYDDRLRPILEETHGTIVYQEQLMQISMVMSGFSPGKADRLRKAMGKKKEDVMAELKGDWAKGAVENGFSADVASEIWKAAESFAAYAFNKSHSAAYAYLVMRTAYLKAHYPTEFMAALLTTYIDDSDHLVKYVASCNRNGTPVLQPDVNESNSDFTPVDQGIRFGLAGIRNVGAGVADAIVAERQSRGPYRNLHDFVDRLDPKCYNRRVLESLVKSGAFDSTGYTRKQLMHFIDETPLLERAARKSRDRAQGQSSMFDLCDSDELGFSETVPEPDGIEWDKGLLLSFEKEIMKMYVSDHPLNPYADEIALISKYTLAELEDYPKSLKSEVFVGIITNLQVKLVKAGENQGKKMAVFDLEDMTGSMPAICFAKVFEKSQQLFENDAIVKIRGRFDHGDRGNQIIVSSIKRLSGLKEAPKRELVITVDQETLTEGSVDMLRGVVSRYPGRDRISIIVDTGSGRRFRAVLPNFVDSTNAALKSEIKETLGQVSFGTSPRANR